MKNLKIFTFVLLLIIITKMHSQSQYSLDCGFSGENVQLPSGGNYSCSIDPAFLDTFESKVFRIHFWQINDSNGNTTPEGVLTENLILETVAKLNIEFNQYRIFFKYTGFSSFDSPPNVELREYNQQHVCYSTNQIDPDGYSVLHHCQLEDMIDYIEDNEIFDPNAFNVYVPRVAHAFGGDAVEAAKTKLVVPIYNLTNPTMIHEIGHNFGLLHTHEFYNKCNCEHSNGSNSCNNGDKVVDTKAVPNFKVEYCYFFIHDGSCPYDDCEYNDIMPHEFIENCDYIGTGEDCTEDPYIILSGDVKNYMAYTEPECRDRFTIGQAIRMHETIAFDPYVEFEAADTDTDELYLPYKGEYYHAGPEPDPRTQPLFQPGFDYVFFACSCENQDTYDCVNGPCDFDENGFQSYTIIVNAIDKYETDYNSITHPNHSSIYIAQLDDIGNRMCYDNYNKSASFGTITQFNDGVFNTNVTVMSQDSTQINNPNLIEDLNP